MRGYAARMKARKKIFLGILLFGIIVMGASASLMIVAAQQNQISLLPQDHTSGQQASIQSGLTSLSSSPSLSTGSTTMGSTAVTQVGPRLMQIALSQAVLSSLLSSQFGAQQQTLADFQVIPVSNNGIVLKFNVQIASNGIHRTLPVEIDTVIGLDGQQNVQLHVLHLKRDGLDAGSTAALQLQNALNPLLDNLLMPRVHTMLKGMKLVGIQTNVALCCVNSEMLVLILQLD